MTRRKQNCPKRMKWEGEGEAPPDGQEEEGSQSGGEEEGSLGTAASSPPNSPPPLEPAVLVQPAEPIAPIREMSPGHDSRGSSIARSPSRDSASSERGTPMPAVSPIALLPPTAAYPQPLHRMLTSPHGSVSPLVSSSSPPILMPANSATSPPLESPEGSTVLDFSTKRSSCESPVLNLSKSGSPPPEVPLNSPLDLSVTSRKRSVDDSSPVSLSPTPQVKKPPRPPAADYKPVVSPWTSPVVASHFPYFAAAVAAANSLSPKSNSQSDIWNGKMKMPDKSFSTPTPSDATKALEKMSELSKLGGDEYRPVGSSGGNRHSAWQSHWLNKGAEQAKDVLKCVWCKQSFPSLAAMTTHMKEAKHCGVNLPSPIIPPPPPPVQQPQQTPVSSPTNLPALNSSSGKSGQNQSDLNLLIKETMPLPRKLVRGQDVWLGKGAEQTRQILKCMWCGQSFRSLAEMTSHMQQTQHYTNIISQEQIISWKSADENKSGSNPSGQSGNQAASGNTTSGNVGSGSVGATGAASSHVSAVLTCKVCDQAFSSLKELSNHMVKNSHYKEHIMRSITESGGRRRQTREKRKKSLPVRKLLELERAQNELKNGEGIMLMNKHGREMHSAGRITCEKCKEKIDMAVFVDHIRLCVGGDQKNLLKNALLSSNMLADPHGNVAQALRETSKMKEEKRRPRSPAPTDLSLGPGSPKDGKPDGKGSSPSVLNAIEKLIEKSFDSRARHGAGGFVGPGMPGQAPIGSSILKRLGIDESVDYTKPLVDAQTMNLLRSYHHQTSAQYRRERSGSESSSISERGRSEAMTPDRKYEQDRYTPRTTPEKRIQTPPSNKACHEETNETEVRVKREASDDEVRVKREPEEVRVKREADEYPIDARTEVTIKQEMENGNEDEEDRRSFQSDEPLAKRLCSEEEARSGGGEDEDQRSQRTAGSPVVSPPASVRPSSRDHVTSPGRNSSSPASSDRSGTPRSTTEKKSSGSLGALSSMFDNLSGGSGAQGEPGSSAAKGASHPLAALQKLCDKTETHAPRSSSTANSAVHAATPGTSNTTTQQSTTPGAILAFSWACNDAVVTADSIMKCAFCDTPFISKGAYRHHLSKMHFVKDGVIPDPVAMKAPGTAGASTPSPSSSSKGPNGNNNGPSTSSGTAKSPQPPQPFEESPHSKFLKYTELAKQLSSKYV
uniref:Putative tiptop transcription factor n=1 Tax=Triatoma infestans TaxID=30076 RepID=A0A023F1Q3_TRIIF